MWGTPSPPGEACTYNRTNFLVLGLGLEVAIPAPADQRGPKVAARTTGRLPDRGAGRYLVVPADARLDLPVAPEVCLAPARWTTGGDKGSSPRAAWPGVSVHPPPPPRGRAWCPPGEPLQPLRSVRPVGCPPPVRGNLSGAPVVASVRRRALQVQVPEQPRFVGAGGMTRVGVPIDRAQVAAVLRVEATGGNVAVLGLDPRVLVAAAPGPVCRVSEEDGAGASTALIRMDADVEELSRARGQARGCVPGATVAPPTWRSPSKARKMPQSERSNLRDQRVGPSSRNAS